MFSSINNIENEIWIKNQKLLGVDSIEFSYSNSANINKFLGSKNGLTTVAGAVKQNISITRSLIYQDPMLLYTGSLSFDGSINSNEKFYGCKSGYLNQYMVSCAVGSIPKITNNITVYDEMTDQKNSFGNVRSPSIYIPRQGSISATCDGSTTNRIVGFDYAITTSRKEIYTIGSKFASEIVTFPVLEYAASVQIELDDLFLRNSAAFLLERQNKTLSFSIKDRDNLTELQSLTIPNASLIGEALSSSADGVVKLTLNYIGHL